MNREGLSDLAPENKDPQPEAEALNSKLSDKTPGLRTAL